MNAPGPSRVLVIKLAALGDLVQALGPFAAIRRHHAAARVTLLTTRPFVELAAAGGWFDDIWIDARPKALDVGGWMALRRRLRGGRFGRVYDLQTSDRSAFYFRLFWPGPRPEWSGIAGGCSHPHDNPRRDFMHTVDRQAEQLARAGIADVAAGDLSSIQADAARFGLSAPYALVVPGGAAHRPAKRWPTGRFAALAAWLAERGIKPVLVGGPEEAALLGAVADACPDALDLAGRTSLLDIVALARGAACAVGNDTGPMHLTAAAGCPSVVLYSDASDPALCAQRGRDVTIVRRPQLADLPVEKVTAALSATGASP
ncbi:MAG: glycosyltransferase family 9 protein [Rhodospirillales bacterium]|nr:glycosyltransferase family 9 protein [Rhodospirillales bacterium]